MGQTDKYKIAKTKSSVSTSPFYRSKPKKGKPGNSL